MAEKYIVQQHRDSEGKEYLPRKEDGSEYAPGEKVILNSPEEHYRSGRLGKIEEEVYKPD